MTGNLPRVLGKALGTLLLAAGLVLMVGKAPFLPDRSAGIADSQSELPRLEIEPGIMGRSSSPLLSPPAPETLAGLQGGMGLYKARFAATETMPGFATEEHKVEGQCTGAGRRYLEQICPGCQLMAQQSADNSPRMLMWMEKVDGGQSMRAVSTDCISVGPDGAPVVGTLQFGGGVADLSAGATGISLDLVPLIPGSSRLAAVEIGNWLATFDDVARPSSAVGDMARALAGRGWREVSGAGAEGRRQSDDERVFTNVRNELCVVTLSKQGDAYQLLTVVSLQM
jgi:hypothetical protein